MTEENSMTERTEVQLDLPPITGAEPKKEKTNPKRQIARDGTFEMIQMAKPTKDDGLAYLKESIKQPELDVIKEETVEKDTPQPNQTPAASEKPTGPPLKKERIGYWELYKYSDSKDKCTVITGLVFSLISGCVLPCYALVLKQVVEAFDPRIDNSERAEILRSFIWGVVLICVLIYISSYISHACMSISAERLSFKLRARYLANLMKQEIAFFEKQQIEALPSKISEYFTHLSDGAGDKTGLLISTVGASCSGIVIGLAICPYYALCLIVYMPFASIIMTQFRKLIMKAVMSKFRMNAKLGAFTEELLSSLKLIISFGKEQDKLNEYKALVNESYQQAKSSALWQGFAGGIFLGTIIGFSCFSWAVGYAMIKYEMPNPNTGENVSVADIIGTYQALMFGMFTVISIQQLIPAVFRALTSGKEIMDVIDRQPKIRSPDDLMKSVKQIQIEDGIKFNDVRFRYPTAPEKARDVFQGASFMVKSGCSTAIVGPSGAGKSTIVQMINRFYDPTAGSITYGSTPLVDIDLPSLREMIGWVGQEPVLIVGTIRQNLLYGNKDATEQDLERAISLANCHFIKQMEKGLETYVGSSTVLNLSGGQKQRIAIARALIKKPQILVLDEATSALDPKSEAEVQTAILNVQKQQAGNLTIIMIAHRLQTIMTADNLLYLEHPTSVLGAQKGTPEYTEIMDRLKKTNYAHQADDVEDEIESVESESDDDDDDKKSQNHSAYSKGSNSMQMGHAERRESKRIQKEIKRDSKLTSAAKKAQKNVESNEGKIVQKTNYVSPNSGWSRLAEFYKPCSLVFAMICLATLNSFAMPLVSYLIINLQYAYFDAGIEDDWEDRAKMYLCIMAAWITSLIFIGGAEKSLFGIMGEKMTAQLQIKLVEEIMHKQISWFDREDRAPGIITSVISSDITLLNGMTSEVLVTIFELVAIIIIGMSAGLYFNWKAAIVCLICSPIMIIGMYMMATMQWGNKGGRREEHQDNEIDNYARSNALLADVIINYRTIISLGQKNVDKINETFEQLLEGPMQDVVNKSNKAGAYYGLGQCGRTLYISIVFYIGLELLVVEWGEDSQNVFTATYMLFFSYMSLGMQISNIPSIGKAKAAAVPVFSIIDEPSQLDVRKPAADSIKVVEKGHIQFVDCNFNYPTRAQKVMNNFNIDIPAGAKIALVGHSGCGKSTLTNILLRFYNINDGKVLIDDKELEKYDVLSLRDQCGYVMQEPVLFNTDIKTNILFGKPEATDEEVYIAAQKANALQFIESNVEDLTKDQKQEKLDKDLKDSFEKVQWQCPTVSQLYSNFSEKHADIKQMVLDLMNSLDNKVLDSAEKSSERFLEAINKCAEKFGSGWADIVIRFQWHDELAKILNDTTLASKLRANVTAMVEKYTDLYGGFNLDSVKKAHASGTSDVEELSVRVREELSNYKMTVVTAQYTKLAYMAIDRKRDADGKFHLSEGFKKDCGPKGGKLSGGQKQRIAIARALIKEPRILILDEATSALDENSQEIVQQALDKAMEGRTSIVIAHRLSTIRNCDILFVLGGGHVLEFGSYDELASDYNSHFNVLKAGMEN